jgi:hypothetical protein
MFLQWESYEEIETVSTIFQKAFVREWFLRVNTSVTVGCLHWILLPYSCTGGNIVLPYTGLACTLPDRWRESLNGG